LVSFESLLDLSALLQHSVDGVDEAALVVLESEVHHVLVQSGFFEIFSLP
jgi:hypothetical protein